MEILGYLVEANPVLPQVGNLLIYQNEIVTTVSYAPIDKTVVVDIKGEQKKLNVSDANLSRLYFMTTDTFASIPDKGLVYTVDHMYLIGLMRMRKHSNSQANYRGRGYYIHDGIIETLWRDYKTLRLHPDSIMYPIRMRIISDLVAGLPSSQAEILSEDEAISSRSEFYKKTEDLLGGIFLDDVSKKRLGMLFGKLTDVVWNQDTMQTILSNRQFIETTR